MGLPIAITCFVLAAAVRIIQVPRPWRFNRGHLVMPVRSTLILRRRWLRSICIAGVHLVVSHVNDAGFWLFGKFYRATEAQTLKTLTMMETIPVRSARLSG